MSEHIYDYVLVGRWRNRDEVKKVLAALREAGKKVYCFIDNSYDGHGISVDMHPDSDPDVMMAATEQLTDWQTNPTFRKIFDTDMEGLRRAKALILLFPAGLAAHMELGVAYGMGKKCYAIGQPEKTETLHLMFDDVFPSAEALLEKLA
jgi:hypothetical protein